MWLTANNSIRKIYQPLLGLLIFFFILSGYWEITKHPITYTKTLAMGYPPYFIMALGIAKVTGAITLLLPRCFRLKEWVFAGFTFDVVFAFISGMSTNHYTDAVKAGVAMVFIMLTYWCFINLRNK